MGTSMPLSFIQETNKANPKVGFGVIDWDILVDLGGYCQF